MSDLTTRPAQFSPLRCAFILGARLGLSAILVGAIPAHAQTSLIFSKAETRRDPSVELALKIKQPFTVVTVGDLIQMIPFSRSNDPDIQALVEIMRNADLTLANNENNIVDHDTFRGVIAHMEAPASVADDWANMGIDIVSKANNHTVDNGDEGLWSNFRELHRVGIEHVGADYNETEARMARFVATPKGTAGMVGIYARSKNIQGLPAETPVYVSDEQLSQLRAMRDSILARRKEVDRPITIPKDAPGEVLVFGVNFKAGKPGDKVIGEANANELMAQMSHSEGRHEKIEAKSNDLRLTVYNGVTAKQMAQLRAIAGDRSGGDTLSAFGTRFRVTPGPGEFTYDMDPQNLRDILREVRTGKQFYDFQAATIHWHQNRYAFQAYSFDHYPASFQVKFAHAVIDQGADLFFAHGVHTLKGVEIYKGKPIFYGQSNFVFQQQIFRSWRDFGAQAPAALTGPILGEGEENEDRWDWLEQPDNLKTLLTSSLYENGELVEVRLYPADLGLSNRPGSQFGTPKRPSPEIARRILEEVQEYSRPFGTRISIENGVGVIRIGG